MKTGRRRSEGKSKRVKVKREVLFISKQPHFLLLTFNLLLWSAPIFGADLQISANLDRSQVALNEQAVLSVVVSGSLSSLPDPQLPNIADFQIYNAGRAQSFSWINGQASASVTHSYVVTPKQEGHFTIPPIRVESHGQTAQTAPLALEVVKGNPAALPPMPDSGRGRQRSLQSRGAPGIFITTTVDKSTVYVGEPVTLNFRLYNRVVLLSNPQYQPPDTSGFWTEDLPPQRTFNATMKGAPYHVTEIRTALFPASPGKATIGPATLRVHLDNISGDPFSDDFFANFFGRGEQKILRTDPIFLHVKPLPEPKPAGFKGAVGHYTLSTSLDKTSAAVGQPLTLTVTVAGRGHIKSIPDIALPPLDNFRTFDASAATNIEKKDYQVQGSKVFKTVLIPTTSGEPTIPSISFVYFDPEERAYKTLHSRALAVNVKPAPAGSPSAATVYPSYGSPAPGIRMLTEDIRYIRTPTSLSSQGPPLYKRKGFRLFHLGMFLLWLGGGLFSWYRRSFLSNPTLIRFRNARARAFAVFQKADEALQSSNVKGAASFLSDALQSYLADKLLLSETGISLKQVLIQLQAKGVLSHTAQKVRALWETLDLFQFAPAQVKTEELRQAAEKLRQLIESLEKEIVWKP